MRFKKPKPLPQNLPAAPPAGLDVLFTSNALVLTTEDPKKFAALYQQYLDEYKPVGPTQCDLVEEMVAAKWRQRRCTIIETAILNITMDRMADQIEKEFVHLHHAARTALAFIHQHGADGALARVSRDEARYTRAWHRALKLLRELQNEKIPNEPEPDLNPAVSIANTDLPRPVMVPPRTGPRVPDTPTAPVRPLATGKDPC